MCPEYASSVVEHTAFAWLLWWTPTQFAGAGVGVACAASLLPLEMRWTRSVVGLGLLCAASQFHNPWHPEFNTIVVVIATAAVMVLAPTWVRARGYRLTVAGWLLPVVSALMVVTCLVSSSVPWSWGSPSAEMRQMLMSDIFAALALLSFTGIGLGAIMGAASFRATGPPSRRLALWGTALVSLGGMAACQRALWSAWFMGCGVHAVAAVAMRDQFWVVAMVCLAWICRLPTERGGAATAASVLLALSLAVTSLQLRQLDMGMAALDVEPALAYPQCPRGHCRQMDDRSMRDGLVRASFPAMAEVHGQIEVRYVHELPAR